MVVQKRPTDCGLAALAMVAGAWGRHWSLDDLAHRMPPGKHGVKLGVLRDLARARGLEAYAIKGNRDDLKNELSNRSARAARTDPAARPQDAIAATTKSRSPMNQQDGTVITIDPATGEWMRRSPAVLDLEWKAAGYATLVVTGDKAGAPAQRPLRSRGAC